MDLSNFWLLLPFVEEYEELDVMATAKALISPPEFDGVADFSKFIAKFRKVATANGWTDNQCFRILAALLVGDAGCVLETVSEQPGTYAALVECLEKIFQPKVSRRLRLMEFNKRTLRHTESARAYASDLKHLFTMANPEIMDEKIIERFVQGLPEDWRVRFYDAQLETLEGHIEKLNVFRVSRATAKPFASSGITNRQVSVRDGVEGGSETVSRNPSIRCYGCQKEGHIRKNCPVVCTSCGLKGHEVSNCRTRCRKCKQVGHIAKACAKQGENNHGVVHRVVAESCPVLSIKINGVNDKAVFDTGSQSSLISEKFADRLDKLVVKETPRKVTTSNRSTTFRTIGEATVEIRWGRRSSERIDVLVVDCTDDVIIGMDFLKVCAAKIDVGGGLLELNGEVVPDVNFSGVVEVRETVVLDSETEVVIPATIRRPFISRRLVEGETMLVGPCLAILEKGFLVARTCVLECYDSVQVVVCNVGDKPVNLEEGELLGEVSVAMFTDEILPPVTRKLDGEQGWMPPLPELEGEQLQQAGDLLSRFKDVFAVGEQVGSIPGVTHKIKTKAGPIKQAPYRLPLYLKEVVNTQIKEMMASKIIEPSNSPWASLLVLVRKKEGTYRFCVDFRKVNEVTKKDSFPLPRMDDLLGAVGSATWLASLDQKSGYWQVHLDEDSKDITAFTTGENLYQFNALPFGLCNAPGTVRSSD